MEVAGEITGLLKELSDEASDPQATLDRLMPLIYGELKDLARSNRYRWSSRYGHGTTSLVHEAYVKLARHEGALPSGRRRFFALASRAMRSVLVDNARWHSRSKRGGSAQPVSTADVQLVSAERADELLALDEALSNLESSRPDLASVVEHRVFGGLTIPETAEALGLSAATIKRRWRLARSWLYRDLRGS